MGGPSGTVAAWRIGAEAVEYLVLGDASVILTDPGREVSESPTIGSSLSPNRSSPAA